MILDNLRLLPEILIILFVFVLLFIACINMRSLHKLSDYKHVKSYPRISALVPARNEETKIRPCVSSLLAQDYPDFQVIVLNDNSTDRTGEILEKMRSRDKRLQIIQGKPLPDDWLGKHWACHQLYLASNGDCLIFTDSDTVHSPRTLTNVAAAMEAEKADMISIIPRHNLGSISEKLIMPFFALAVFTVIPLLSRFRPKSVKLMSSSGKLMAFKRNAYEATGGFASVRQNVLDDLQLPQGIQEGGLRYRLFDGTDNVTCRMYHNFKEVHEGLTKNMFAAYGYNVPLFLLTWLWISFAFWEPIIMLFILKIPQYAPTLSYGLAVISIMGTLSLWAIYYQRFKFPLYMVIFYPVSAITLTAIAVSSMVLTLSGRAKWKNRKMPTHKLY